MNESERTLKIDSKNSIYIEIFLFSFIKNNSKIS